LIILNRLAAFEEEATIGHSPVDLRVVRDRLAERDHLIGENLVGRRAKRLCIERIAGHLRRHGGVHDGIVRFQHLFYLFAGPTRAAGLFNALYD